MDQPPTYEMGSTEFDKEFYSALTKDKPESITPDIQQLLNPANNGTKTEPEKVEEKTEQKPELKKEEIEVKEEEVQFKSEKARDNWKKMRDSHNDQVSKLTAQIKDLEGKLKIVPSKPEVPADYEAIKKEHAELSDRIRLLDVERHPRFKAYFDSKMNALSQQAKLAMGDSEADKLMKVISAPDSEYRTEKLNQLVSELYAEKPALAVRVSGIIQKADEISMERHEEISKAKQSYEQIQQQQQAQQREQLSKLEKTFETELSKAQEAVPVFQKRPGEEQWNTEVESRIEQAKKIFSGQISAEDAARAAIWSASAESLLKSSLSLSKEVDSLKAELNKLKSVTPDPSGTVGDVTTPSPDGDENDPHARAAKFFSANPIGR